MSGLDPRKREGKNNGNKWHFYTTVAGLSCLPPGCTEPRRSGEHAGCVGGVCVCVCGVGGGGGGGGGEAGGGKGCHIKASMWGIGKDTQGRRTRIVDAGEGPALQQPRHPCTPEAGPSCLPPGYTARQLPSTGRQAGPRTEALRRLGWPLLPQCLPATTHKVLGSLHIGLADDLHLYSDAGLTDPELKPEEKASQQSSSHSESQ